MAFRQYLKIAHVSANGLYAGAANAYSFAFAVSRSIKTVPDSRSCPLSNLAVDEGHPFKMVLDRHP